MVWKFLKIIFFVFLFAFLMLFLFSNVDSDTLGHEIRFHLKFSQIQYDLIPFRVGELIILSFFLGALSAITLGAMTAFSKNHELKSKKRAIEELERENEELRALCNSQRKEVLPSHTVLSTSSSQQPPQDPLIE